VLALYYGGPRFESWHRKNLFRVVVERFQQPNSTLPWLQRSLNNEPPEKHWPPAETNNRFRNVRPNNASRSSWWNIPEKLAIPPTRSASGSFSSETREIRPNGASIIEGNYKRSWLQIRRPQAFRNTPNNLVIFANFYFVCMWQNGTLIQRYAKNPWNGRWLLVYSRIMVQRRYDRFLAYQFPINFQNWLDKFFEPGRGYRAPATGGPCHCHINFQCLRNAKILKPDACQKFNECAFN
jgi:hypothetical protein